MFDHVALSDSTGVLVFRKFVIITKNFFGGYVLIMIKDVTRRGNTMTEGKALNLSTTSTCNEIKFKIGLQFV